jgi:tRNA (mo5U34)-methyltransferase
MRRVSQSPLQRCGSRRGAKGFWVPIDPAEVRKRIDAHRWYHTLELAPGVMTPGWFDTRPALARIGFPASLSGARCLDVGTFDGFWAFEMEKRGAAEVVAIDVLDPLQWDWPYGSAPETVDEMSTVKAGGAGFDLAAELLGSAVRRLERSVYELDPSIDGEFDFVYVGSLLLHLRDPLAAIAAVRSVARGSVMFVDAVDLFLSVAFPRKAVANFDGIGRPWWWKPNAVALARMVKSGGFDVVDGPKRFYMQPGGGQVLARPTVRTLLHAEGRYAAVAKARGEPHAVVVARRR